jgi:hypothetical protein
MSCRVSKRITTSQTKLVRLTDTASACASKRVSRTCARPTTYLTAQYETEGQLLFKKLQGLEDANQHCRGGVGQSMRPSASICSG